MRKITAVGVLLVLVCSVVPNNKAAGADETETHPWVGKYCMSLFTKTRTAKTVGKGHISTSLKVQHFDWNLVRGADNDYHGRGEGQSKRKLATTLCTKYGWAEDHHIVVGVPFFFNDFDLPGSSGNDSRGLGNVFIFEKWNIIKETNDRPGVAVDFWTYLPTGDSKRKLGSDDGAFKVTTEISKAWKDFSLHFNPGYRWGQDKDADMGEINGGLLWTMNPKLWPAVEYNYFDQEGKGHRHGIVPGVIWKFAKGASFKVGVPICLDTTFTDKDRVGIVFKLFYRH